MAGMGPAPKPADQRARRNASVSMTSLPRSGRPGAAPAWPLGADGGIESVIAIAKVDIKTLTLEVRDAADARERAAKNRKLDKARRDLITAQMKKKLTGVEERKIWRDLWKLPQATQWEKRGWFREVALYTRHQAKAEAGSLDDAKEARQWSDRLGLNDMAMLRLRWQIVDDSGSAAAPAPRRSKRNASKYAGLTVVSS